MKALFSIICVLVVLSQTSAYCQSQSVDPALSDSSQIASLSPQQYDFYYSSKQADAFEKVNMASYTLAGRIKKNRFRDKTYTEVVAKGQPHTGGFDDYVLIGSGRMNEIRQNGEW